MIKYLTGAEFNALFTEQLNNETYSDDTGRDIAKWATEFYNNDKKLTFKYALAKKYVDLFVTLINNNKTSIGIESKYRMLDLNEKKYTTHLINEDKVMSINKNYNAKKIDSCFLISIWSMNDLIWVTNVMNTNYYAGKCLKLCNDTTNGERNGRKVWKECYLYRPEKIMYYCWRYDSETNIYTILFDKEKPFDVNKLNAELEKSIELF